MAELRAAVVLAHARGSEDSVCWSVEVWVRLWQRLTPEQQQVVYLHVIVGLTITEAAVQLEVSRASVHGLYQRALERIRNSLQPF